MLKLKIPAGEVYDETNNLFIDIKEETLVLEHSLMSISKWESKWQKPFLDNKIPKTRKENLDYVKCMTVNQVNPNIYYILPAKAFEEINKYIDQPMTATKIYEDKKPPGPGKKPIITSEVVYYWMISLNIPFECQKWHFNKLMALINTCNAKNGGGKKLSTAERRALNESRKAKYNTRG